MDVTPVLPWNVTVECMGEKSSKIIDLKVIGKEHQSKYSLCNPVWLKKIKSNVQAMGVFILN